MPGIWTSRHVVAFKQREQVGRVGYERRQGSGYDSGGQVSDLSVIDDGGIPCLHLVLLTFAPVYG